jgi:hypothetical protein
LDLFGACSEQITAGFMSFFDGLWHLCNFFAPALGVGLIAATLAKLLWRHLLAGVAWRTLAQRACVACAVALLGGLVLSGRDGRMLTYAAMVLACALALWWSGFGPRRAR